MHFGYGKDDPAGDNQWQLPQRHPPPRLSRESLGSWIRRWIATGEPEIVTIGQRRFEGFDKALLSLSARGLTTREIEGYLLETYRVEVSPGLGVSQVIEAVCAGVQSGEIILFISTGSIGAPAARTTWPMRRLKRCMKVQMPSRTEEKSSGFPRYGTRG